MPNLKILRLPEVKNLTGLCRSSIYDGMKHGTFPKSISLGARAIGWLNSDIQQWIAERIMTSSLTEPEDCHPIKTLKHTPGIELSS